MKISSLNERFGVSLSIEQDRPMLSLAAHKHLVTREYEISLMVDGYASGESIGLASHEYAVASMVDSYMGRVKVKSYGYISKNDKRDEGKGIENYLKTRCVRNLIAREFQVYRESSSRLFAQRTGASKRAIQSYAGTCSIYKMQGAIQQKYKLWIVVNPSLAAKHLRKQKIALLRDEAKALVRKRSHPASHP